MGPKEEDGLLIFRLVVLTLKLNHFFFFLTLKLNHCHMELSQLSVCFHGPTHSHGCSHTVKRKIPLPWFT